MRFLKIILFLLLTSCVKTISLNDLDSSVVKYEDLPDNFQCEVCRVGKENFFLQ